MTGHGEKTNESFSPDTATVLSCVSGRNVGCLLTEILQTQCLDVQISTLRENVLTLRGEWWLK